MNNQKIIYYTLLFVLILFVLYMSVQDSQKEGNVLPLTDSPQYEKNKTDASSIFQNGSDKKVIDKKPIDKIVINNSKTETIEGSQASEEDPEKKFYLQPEIREALEEMINTSSEGLIEKKTKDGITVDLEGRFQSVPVAVINDEGDVIVKDFSSNPDKVEKK